MDFKLHSDYQPTGDQPQAIKELVTQLCTKQITNNKRLLLQYEEWSALEGDAAKGNLAVTTAKRLLSDFSTEVENIRYIQYPGSQGVL